MTILSNNAPFSEGLAVVRVLRSSLGALSGAPNSTNLVAYCEQFSSRMLRDFPFLQLKRDQL